MEIRPPDPTHRLAAIVESSDDAIVSKDLNGIITSWNRGAEQLFGYTAAEAIGRSITILIPHERLGEEDMVLGRIRRGDRVDHFDTVRRRKDGSFVDISLTVSPIRDASGTVVGASKIARDISYRKRFESELEDLQRRLMALAVASASVLGSPDSGAVLTAAIAVARDVFASDAYAFWRLESDGSWRIVRSSGVSQEFAARAIPHANQAPATAPFPEPLIFDDVDVSPTLAEMRDAYRQEGVVSMIVFPLAIHGQRSGTMVFYSRRRRTYSDVDVKVGAALANLTAAALTTAELYEEQRHAREAADHARQQATYLADVGTALSVSLDYEATLKSVATLAVPTIADWVAVDVVGEHGSLQRLAVAHVDPAKLELARTVEERYPTDPNAPGGVHAVIRTGKPAYMSRIPPHLIEAAARDAEHLRILRELNLTSYMCVPLMARGKAFGAITFVSAESGREYSEVDLRFARELATRASLAVENARAYARANEASRLKDEFLATLSHELRTPLNAVLGYARMLRLQTLPPEKVAPALETVERNATALKQMIEDVLEVSRIVAGRLRLNVEPVDLPAILRDAVATVSPAVEAKGVRLETIIDTLTTPVSGDADRLQQIVWNLLSNAIKFTPRGGRVQLRLARVDSHVEVSVSDTGRGIPEEFLPFVFERFRQADASFSREHGGLGLGLAIAKQLTELHGGTIAVASGGLGQGATFTITLPLMIVHQPQPVPREQPSADREEPSSTEMPRLDGVDVLAVDDEPDSLNLLRTVLEGAGASVTTARSAREALDLLETARPEVIVADVGMPGMDGLQFIRTVRQLDEPIRSTPAAALTAYARSRDRITSLASGFQMHLVKPIDPVELVVAIATLVPRRSGAVNDPR
ncbi:MAG TPA: ATP-binding protein [Vicinamibacterales bacterium]|nr:ATP-binding protein [Vicinamibacterales bacterium]